ncbi:Sec15 hypothetical exocyst subunit [Pseudohyphozyma bogoriensis]|nr:Sec15 hypothetical exocyst subunit [Pseudohyphozyma bogoriensis]
MSVQPPTFKQRTRPTPPWLVQGARWAIDEYFTLEGPEKLSERSQTQLWALVRDQELTPPAGEPPRYNNVCGVILDANSAAELETIADVWWKKSLDKYYEWLRTANPRAAAIHDATQELLSYLETPVEPREVNSLRHQFDQNLSERSQQAAV